MERETSVRSHVRGLLDWEDSHVGFDRATKGITFRLAGVTPAGFPHSAWQLVEHMRLAQADILEFCRAQAYREKKWPDDYWPANASPSGSGAWRSSIAAFRADRAALMRLASNARVDLLQPIPHGTGQTYLRELLLSADHTAYHVGQLMLVRKALGIWR
jgi:hypothetical protein